VNTVTNSGSSKGGESDKVSDYRRLKDSKRKKTATGKKMKQMDPVPWAQNLAHEQDVSTTHDLATPFTNWHPPT